MIIMLTSLRCGEDKKVTKGVEMTYKKESCTQILVMTITTEAQWMLVLLLGGNCVPPGYKLPNSGQL